MKVSQIIEELLLFPQDMELMYEGNCYPQILTQQVLLGMTLHETYLRREAEKQLAYCAERIHNQREEIKRLEARR